MSNATTRLETADLDRLIERLEMEPTSASLDSPIRLGHFILHERLGEGGMGIVYRAARDGRPGFLAIKVVPALLATPSAVARMRREAELLSRLDLPGVVGIIESGVAMTELGEQPYIAMDLIKGEHIDEYTRRTNASPARVIHLIKDLCGIVGQAHRAGVIHRDIKPSNILVDEHGQIQVLDFGIARSTLSSDQHACITSTGAHLGTPKYMSPEQQRGEPVGPQADVYAIAKLTSDLLDIAESKGDAPSRDEHVVNAIAWATRARADQRCPSTIALAEAFETTPQTARYRLIPRTILPLTAAAIVTAAAALGLGDARNTSPVDRQGSSEIQDMLQTDAAITRSTRSSQGIARAQIDHVKTMTDTAIVQFAEPEPIASASRQLLDALGLACWDRGMDNTASTFFDQAVIAAGREGLGPANPKWHRQIQLQAEAQIRTGGFLEAIAIIDDATTSARADHTQPIGPAIASNARSPLLRLWWTRAIAMDRLGDHADAADLLTRVLDAQLDGYPDHTDWLDSLDDLTQMLIHMGQREDALLVLSLHPVPMGIQDTRIHERHDRIRSSVDQSGAFQGR